LALIFRRIFMARKKNEELNEDNNLQENINIDNSGAEDEKTPPKPNENENGKENENGENESSKNETSSNKTVRIKAKSNTGFKNYYRCNLRFAPEFSYFEVSPEVLDSLKNDCHLTIVEEAEKE